MSIESKDDFDAGAYWRDRVISGSDLAIVGHRSMGPAYNSEIYARRIEVLEKVVPELVSGSMANTKLLDIGCGSGFYTNYWQKLGVKEYVGLDISKNTVDYLSESFPDFKFDQADIARLIPQSAEQGGPFDIVTVFDVLYHIVDSTLFESAVANVGKTVKTGGHVIVMDQLHRNQYQISKHVVYRDRDYYLSQFEQHNLKLVGSELLFHFLVPPVTGIRLLDYLAAFAFRMTGIGIRRMDFASKILATSMRRLDTFLRHHDIKASNSELLVFRKY